MMTTSEERHGEVRHDEIRHGEVRRGACRVRRALAAAGSVLALTAAAGTLTGCERIKTAYAGLFGVELAAEAVETEATVYAVNTIPATEGQIRDYLALSGDIVAGSTVDAYPDVAGKVTRLYVAVGDKVSRGATIATVDPSRPGMEYKASVVKAPVAGTVVALPAQVGMTVSQQVALARIAAGSALDVRLYVAERFISKVYTGQSCEITLDAYPGEVFAGRVSEVSPTVDPSSRTMETKVTVEDPTNRLKAGMFAKVKIITEEKEGIVKIPASALIQRFGEEYVFTAEPDPGTQGYVARKRVITPGISIDGVLEVSRGLAPDDDVIVKGQSLLEDGTRVNIVDRLPPLSAAVN